MIHSLIIIAIIIVAFGVIVYAINRYLAVEQPWKGAAILIVIIIGVLLCLQQLGIVNV